MRTRQTHILKILGIALGIVCVFGAFALPKSSHAAFNKNINYQGKLTNNEGAAVADGLYNMEFNLYTVATGGTAVWTETLTSTNKVQVTNGLFSVMLGSTTALTSVNFNQTLYLGVTIGGTGSPSWDSEMSPRKVLGAVPAALVSDTLDNLSSEQFLRADAANSTSTTSTFFSITNSGTGDIARFIGASSVNALTIKSNGNVGIGTTTPWRALSVHGSSDLGTNALAGSFTGTSTATSTLAGGLSTNLLRVTSTTASSTFSNGINLEGGCFAVSGTCISSGAASQWTTATNDIYYTTGKVGVGTTSPWRTLSVHGSSDLGTNALAGSFTGTSTATSTFAGGFSTNLLHITSATASSTFANGINLERGCFAIAGTCLSSGGGSSQWTTATNDIYYTTGKVGIGTTSPWRTLSVHGSSDLGINALAGTFTATSTTGTSTFAGGFSAAGSSGLTVLQSGNVGIGTDAPQYKLSVSGSTYLSSNVGIGTAPGSYTLSVGGDVSSTGTFYGNGNGLTSLNLTGYNVSTLTNDSGYLTSISGLSISQLNNDSGYITGISGLNISQLNNDSGYITGISGLNISQLNNDSGYISSLSGQNISQLTNDSGYITNVGVGGSEGAIQWNDGSSGIDGSDNFSWSNASSRLYVNGKVGVGTTTPWAKFSINPVAGDGPSFVIGSSTDTKFIVNNAGNVGIGTTSPWRKLSVNGSSDLGTNALAGSFTGTSTATSTFAGGFSTNLLSVTSTTASSTFANGINLERGCFAIAGTCLSSGGGSSQWTTSGSNIYYTGNVGIGTSTSPSATLDVGTTSPTFKLTDSTASSYLKLTKVNTSNKLTLSNTVSTGGTPYALSSPANTDGSYVTFASAPSITGNFSISAWINMSATRGNGNNTIIDVGAFGSNNGFGLWINGSGNLGWRINQNFNNYATGYTLSTNTWVHVMVIYNGSTVSLYANNTLINGPSSMTTNPNAASVMKFMCRDGGASECFYGKIDEVMIFNKALDSTERSTYYNSGSGYYGNSSLSGLVAAYHLDEGTGTSVSGYSTSPISGTVTSLNWVTGFVSASIAESTVLVSEDGSGGDIGLITLGNNSGKSVINGTAVAMSIAGTEKARLSSTGNFGIGTTTPFGKLAINPVAGDGHSLVIGSTTNTVMVVTNGGRLGLGTSSPASTLTVTGSACISKGAGSATAACSTTAGTITATVFNTASADLAEKYSVVDESIEEADIVALDPDHAVTVKKAEQGTGVFGIISTEPGFLLGSSNLPEDASSTRAVALAGRVPVKFSLEGGPVRIGDALTLSSQPGIAKKAAPGTRNIIGTALENQDKEGKVLVFVRAGFGNIAHGSSTDIADASGIIDTLKGAVLALKELVVHTLHVTVASIKTLAVEALTIGTPAKPTAVTVYDKNGQPGCMTIDNVATGAFVVTPGACEISEGDLAPTSTTTPTVTISPLTPPTTNISIGSSTEVSSGTSTTEIITLPQPNTETTVTITPALESSAVSSQPGVSEPQVEIVDAPIAVSEASPAPANPE